MNADIRRTVIVVGLVVAASLAGRMLGDFAVAGVAAVHEPTSQVEDAQRVAMEREAPRSGSLGRVNDGQTSDAEGTIAPSFSKPEAHDCEGCDARLNRDRDLATMISGLGTIGDDVRGAVPPEDVPSWPQGSLY